MKYGNYRDGFFLPNELFQLGLDYGELAVYSFLKRCENRKTHQCWPSIKTIGQAVRMSENTVRKYIRRLEERGLIVTNGDQTDTICEGHGFVAALRTRTFEPDAPNWTPRISGLAEPDGSYKLSILRSADPEGARCIRCFYEYEPEPGKARFLSTYEGFGSPLPSFSGEPVEVCLPDCSARVLAERLWGSLDEANRVSLYVAAHGEEIIINKYEEARR